MKDTTITTNETARDILQGLNQELHEAIDDFDNFTIMELLGLLLHCTDLLGDVLTASDDAHEHLTALGYCWSNGLRCDALTLVALQRVAARISAQKGVPMGYEYNPDFSGEGITFRHDVLQIAARELELESSTN